MDRHAPAVVENGAAQTGTTASVDFVTMAPELTAVGAAAGAASPAEPTNAAAGAARASPAAAAEATIASVPGSASSAATIITVSAISVAANQPPAVLCAPTPSASWTRSAVAIIAPVFSRISAIAAAQVAAGAAYDIGAIPTRKYRAAAPSASQTNSAI